MRVAAPRSLLVLAALLVSACVARAPRTAAELEATLRRASKTVVDGESFMLCSPYGERETEPFAAVLRDETGLVRRLFADAGRPAVRIYLVPIEADDESDASASGEVPPWVHVGRDGREGGAFEAGFAYLYVPAQLDATYAHVRAHFTRKPLRHELAHLYSRRAALVRATWFHEGIAREVESMAADGGTLRPHRFPPEVFFARATVKEGSTAKLLRWRLADGGAPAELRRLYGEAQALVRFLVEREATTGEWLARVRAVHALDDAAIEALEPEWIEWLAKLDPLDAIRKGARSSVTSERGESAALLPVLAESRVAELATREADVLALDLLDEPEASESAATFLLYFRARALESADVEALRSSPDPARRLTGWALRARRGEEVDLADARATWAAITERDRARYTVQAASIPGLEAR